VARSQMNHLGKTAFVLIACLSLRVPLHAQEKPIDVTRSKITVHVGKTGLFSMAGHEHQVSAPVNQGAINESSPGHVWFRLDARTLTVLPEKDQAEVQSTMQRQVLESERFPEIRFESTGIQQLAANHWKVEGKLTLHGQTHPVIADVHRSGASYEGKSTIKQTDFGIQPVSVAGGTVKVKNELAIEFSIQLRNQRED
jgi:polyisoprenoid-binding protein YceI